MPDATESKFKVHLRNLYVFFICCVLSLTSTHTYIRSLSFHVVSLFICVIYIHLIIFLKTKRFALDSNTIKTVYTINSINPSIIRSTRIHAFNQSNSLSTFLLSFSIFFQIISNNQINQIESI